MDDICYVCDGTGDGDWPSDAPCRECKGTGWREEPEDDERWPIDYESLIRDDEEEGA